MNFDKKTKYLKKFILIIILGIISILVNYKYISFSTDKLIFKNINDLPKAEYGLFLGTSKYLPSGNINNYYKNRIEATIKLYEKNKIEKIIISANIFNHYKENEVKLIKYDLIERGIKKEDIILDNNGERTWKSINNLEEKQIENKIIVISQKFHLERALYIAKIKNKNLIGFEAKGKMSNYLLIREILARVKMQLDRLMN